MNRATLIWVVLAVVAVLIIAMFALNRPEAAENIEDAANGFATTTSLTADRAAARAEAETELAALRARAEAGETYDQLAGGFAEVRANLASAYQNAEGEAAQEWAELSADFDTFEASARAGTSDFLDSITSLIGRISADVRVETEAE